MKRTRRWMVLALAAGFAAAFVAAVQAAEGPRRGPGRGGRGSLLGLLRLEQVRTEIKLTDEQAAKVREMAEKIGAEMREQFGALRDIEDRDQRRAKMAELRDETDRKAREQLREVLQREQMMRLYQIRMQVRPVVDSLANRYVAGRLKLTDEQKEKVAAISDELQKKQSEIFTGMREASQEQRSEAFQKLRTLRSETDEKALAVLTAEQKEAFETMKGEKIELQRPGN